jgi:hypothetical protein
MPALNMPARAGQGIFFESATFSSAVKGQLTCVGEVYPCEAPSRFVGGAAAAAPKLAAAAGAGLVAVAAAAGAFVSGFNGGTTGLPATGRLVFINAAILQ